MRKTLAAVATVVLSLTIVAGTAPTANAWGHSCTRTTAKKAC